jgi:DNA-binding GntR family transcriptional regulator
VAPAALRVAARQFITVGTFMMQGSQGATADEALADDDKTADRRPKFTRIKPASLADEVAERIVQAIADGILLPGERIIETQLAEQLHVSRVPVRDALRALEKQGIVVVTPHRGARVMDINLDLYRQVQEVRLDLEMRAIADFVGRLADEPDCAKRLKDRLKELDAAVAADDRGRYNKLDVEFHRWICHSARNHIVTTLWEALSRHLRILLGLMAEDWQVIKASQADHKKLVGLILAGDMAGIRELMTHHLFQDIERVDYDPAVHRFTLNPSRRRSARAT